MKETLLDTVSMMLLKQGYLLKRLTRTCFDLLARDATNILLIKVLEDANAITNETATEMLKIGAYIQAAPLVVAEKAGQKLEPNVVYTRFHILTLNPETLRNAAQQKFPFLKRDQTGLIAQINPDKLKHEREKAGLSLNALAKKLGVSTRMVSKYEQGHTHLTINKAFKLYDLLGNQVFEKIDIFHAGKPIASDPHSSVAHKYINLGFEASDTKKAPFDVIARKEKNIVLTDIGDKTNPHMESLSKLLDADMLSIFSKHKPKKIPALTKKEFLEFEKASELLKFLKEFE